MEKGARTYSVVRRLRELDGPSFLDSDGTRADPAVLASGSRPLVRAPFRTPPRREGAPSGSLAGPSGPAAPARWRGRFSQRQIAANRMPSDAKKLAGRSRRIATPGANDFDHTAYALSNNP